MAFQQSDNMHKFSKVLGSAKNIIVVAGAGLSAASGIPTFRGKGGMWRKYDAISLATPEAFKENPSLVWQFYNYRRESALKVKPNAAHAAIARFSLPSIRQSIAPDSKFTLITQNVDGLSPLALEDALSKSTDAADKAAQKSVIEMHGRLFDVQCTECNHVEFNRSSPICKGLEGTEQLVEKNAMDPEIPFSSLPRCSSCGVLARPGVVWFGESIPHLEVIEDIVAEADLCIVVGTSSTVQPAASFADEVQEQGGKVAVFNLERSEGDSNADFLFIGPCEDLLPKALGLEN
ncbi:DHS-like NAD/FAD-binding domain-containing protein [Rhodocollybia butyracea]|uniref:NAD-dependent protein deacylase n=1 Tax=Rhodocollybia butyracea TaxID=206335 RepID=A0A9P5Q9V2_9AGAR|nr:DHS-like NAD/FAD-binding domain-containing protein [Rhodocollybia butyracea]